MEYISSSATNYLVNSLNRISPEYIQNTHIFGRKSELSDRKIVKFLGVPCIFMIFMSPTQCYHHNNAEHKHFKFIKS